ncbi:MAG: MarR family transcriptional regulator [Lachnospiraceae bacterium]|nr:MarR family transcriptional regulator [Lachnospiraceae bacterium]
MNDREVINDILVHLFNDIMALEEAAIIDKKYEDISNSEMHVLDAVGPEGGNMSTIAAKLRITMGSLTTAMNRLVLKGYVERNRSETDRRVVNITLTEKGLLAYERHRKFHMRMVDAALKDVSEDQVPVLVNMLTNLKTFFYQYEKVRTKE